MLSSGLADAASMANILKAFNKVSQWQAASWCLFEVSHAFDIDAWLKQTRKHRLQYMLHRSPGGCLCPTFVRTHCFFLGGGGEGVCKVQEWRCFVASCNLRPTVSEDTSWHHYVTVAESCGLQSEWQQALLLLEKRLPRERATDQDHSG